MTNVARALLPALILAVGCASSGGSTTNRGSPPQSTAQTPPGQPAPPAGMPPMTPEMQAEMQAAAEAATPGPAHRELAKLAGDYATASRFTMAPGAAPIESAGTAKLTVALDGRFLFEENTGTMIGAPVRGLRLYGYNNATKKYEAAWTWTLATAMLTLTGTSADGGTTIDFTGAYSDAKGALQALQVRLKVLDDDRFTITTSAAAGATVEVTYTRRR